MAHYVEPAFAAQKARLSAAPRRGEHESAERALLPLRDGNSRIDSPWRAGDARKRQITCNDIGLGRNGLRLLV